MITKSKMRGAGAWLRSTRDLTPEQAAESLDFVVLALYHRDSECNRGPAWRAWCGEYRGRGGVIYAMDWLPTAESGCGHVEELCDAARAFGCSGVMVDAEPDAGWRDALKEARAYAAELKRCAGDDLETSVTDYGRRGSSDKVMRAWLAVLDAGVPQSYDPRGRYTEDYHELARDYWRERGARRVIMGLGLWIARPGGKSENKRHRTPAEFAQHLEGVPEDIDAICVWYGARKSRGRFLPQPKLHAILPQLRAWSDARIGAGEKARPWTRDELATMAIRARLAGDDLAADALAESLARLGDLPKRAWARAELVSGALRALRAGDDLAEREMTAAYGRLLE